MPYGNSPSGNGVQVGPHHRRGPSGRAGRGRSPSQHGFRSAGRPYASGPPGDGQHGSDRAGSVGRNGHQALRAGGDDLARGRGSGPGRLHPAQPGRPALDGGRSDPFRRDQGTPRGVLAVRRVLRRCAVGSDGVGDLGGQASSPDAPHRRGCRQLPGRGDLGPHADGGSAGRPGRAREGDRRVRRHSLDRVRGAHRRWGHSPLATGLDESSSSSAHRHPSGDHPDPAGGHVHRPRALLHRGNSPFIPHVG